MLPRVFRRRRERTSFAEGGRTLFLCPVCAQHLLGEDGLLSAPCAHVLLVHAPSGLAYWRDESARSAFAQVERLFDNRDGRAVAVLRTALGPDVALFDLIEEERGTVTLLIDLAENRSIPDALP